MWTGLHEPAPVEDLVGQRASSPRDLGRLQVGRRAANHVGDACGQEGLVRVERRRKVVVGRRPALAERGRGRMGMGGADQDAIGGNARCARMRRAWRGRGRTAVRRGCPRPRWPPSTCRRRAPGQRACNSSCTYVAGNGAQPPTIGAPSGGVMLAVAAPACSRAAGACAIRPAGRHATISAATMPSLTLRDVIARSLLQQRPMATPDGSAGVGSRRPSGRRSLPACVDLKVDAYNARTQIWSVCSSVPNMNTCVPTGANPCLR